MTVIIASFFFFFAFFSIIIAIIIAKAAKSPKIYRSDSFWKDFTGNEALEMLNREIRTKPATKINKVDFFMNETGLYFIIKNLWDSAEQGFCVRFNKNQNFNVHVPVYDFLGSRIEQDRVSFTISRVDIWSKTTEIIFSNTSLNERNKIKSFLEKAKK